MKKLLQVLCLVLGAWMMCGSVANAQNAEIGKNITLSYSDGSFNISNANFNRSAKSIKIFFDFGEKSLVWGSVAYNKWNAMDSATNLLTLNSSKRYYTIIVTQSDIISEIASNSGVSVNYGDARTIKVIVTNYDTTNGAANDNSEASGIEPGSSGGSNTGGSTGSTITPSTKTLAEKIAAREQLTNLATVYMTVPDAEGKNINDVLFKDRATNVADYHQTTIQVVENGCNDGTGRTLGNFTEAGLEIKVRGNSTAEMDKRPYRLRFYKDEKDAAGNVTVSHKHDMLGYGYEKRNWTILNNMRDGSYMQNAITYYIGKAVGMPFCPGYKFVDLVINNEYRGCYQLSDHVEVGSNRIDIDESTGWFVESTRNDMVEEPYFNSAGLYVLIKNPESKTEAGTAEIKQMIQQYFDNNNNNIFGIYATGCDDKTFCDPKLGWRSVFDEESLVRFYVGLNLTGDSDGMMQVKMYRETDGKMQFGPLWDKDLAFGVQDDGKTLAEGNSLEFGAPTFNNYIKKIMKTDPVFVKKVHDKLHEVIDNGYVENIIKEMDKIEKSLLQTKTLEYNNTGWKAVSIDNYPVAVERLRQYVRDHTKWFVDFMDERYESMGGDNIKIPTDDGTVGPVDTFDPVSTLAIDNATDKSFKVPASAFSSKATSIKVTFTPTNTSQSYWGFYGFNGSEWNAKGFNGTTAPSVTVTITDAADIATVAKNGMSCRIQSNGTIGDLTVKVENEIPEVADCTHTYTTDNCTTDTDGILHRTCSKCGAEESDVNYYEFTVYPESATTQTVIAKSWTPAADKPNSIAMVKITSGLEKNVQGYNIVNSTKNADGNQTCADFRLTDGHPYYSDKKFVAAKATYTRTLSADEEYGMMTLPFKHQDAENADAEFYHIDKVEAGKIYLTAIDPSIEGNASAYLPVFFKRKAGKNSVTVTGTDITVKKTTTTDKTNSTCEGWTIVGAVENASATAAGLYEMSDAKTGTVSNVSSVSIAPYRAYLSTTVSAPQTLTLVLPGGEEVEITLSTLVNAIEKMKTENVTVEDIEAIVNKLLEKE